jgi:hypothetical protein
VDININNLTAILRVAVFSKEVHPTSRDRSRWKDV